MKKQITILLELHLSLVDRSAMADHADWDAI